MATLRTLFGLAVVLTIIACGEPSATTSPSAQGSDATGLAGSAIAGPVCPVETTPPDPACAPRPVAGAVLIIRDGTGREVARATSAANGTFSAALEAGAYVVEPQPAEGLMGTAPAEDVTVTAGATTTIEVIYDTGIRGPAVAPS